MLAAAPHVPGFRFEPSPDLPIWKSRCRSWGCKKRTSSALRAPTESSGAASATVRPASISSGVRASSHRCHAASAASVACQPLQCRRIPAPRARSGLRARAAVGSSDGWGSSQHRGHRKNQTLQTRLRTSASEGPGSATRTSRRACRSAARCPGRTVVAQPGESPDEPHRRPAAAGVPETLPSPPRRPA